MNWGSVGKGFVSVADDIARSQMGQRIGAEYIDDAMKAVGRGMKGISADYAARYMAEAQDDAARWYAKFVEGAGRVPVDENEMLYRIGRCAAHTCNFARDNMGNVINIGMTGMMVAPMAMQFLPRSQEEQYG